MLHINKYRAALIGLGLTCLPYAVVMLSGVFGQGGAA